MANTIKVNNKTISYTSSSITTSTITFSDGTVVKINGTVSSATVLAAYNAAHPVVVTPPIVVTPPVTTPVSGTPILIGNAELAVLSNVSNKSYILKPGVYTTRSDWSNLTNVTIDGQNGVTFSTGGRAFQANGKVDGLTLKNMSFKDIKDYVFDYWGNGAVKYDGTAGSFINGLTVDNVTATNCGTLIHVDGGITNGVHYGLIKNFKLSNMTFKDSPEPNSVIYLGNAMNYDISNCVVDNINYTSSTPNAPNGLHNGIFQLCGWGNFYNNKITNHQGEAVRSWLFSHDATVQTVNIYNNIIWNSKKYGAFELQNEPTYAANGALPCNASIRNNTAGHLNTDLDWEGQLLDLYQIPGKLELINNIGFEMNHQDVDGKPSVAGARTNMTNAEGSAAGGFTATNNIYYATQAQAVANTTTFKTLVTSAGAQV